MFCSCSFFLTLLLKSICVCVFVGGSVGSSQQPETGPFPVSLKPSAVDSGEALQGLAESALVLKFSIKQANFCPLDYTTHARKSAHTSTSGTATRKVSFTGRYLTPPFLYISSRGYCSAAFHQAKGVTQAKCRKALASSAKVY